jgi:hypothetical protein
MHFSNESGDILNVGWIDAIGTKIFNWEQMHIG